MVISSYIKISVGIKLCNFISSSTALLFFHCLSRTWHFRQTLILPCVWSNPPADLYEVHILFKLEMGLYTSLVSWHLWASVWGVGIRNHFTKSAPGQNSIYMRRNIVSMCQQLWDKPTGSIFYIQLQEMFRNKNGWCVKILQHTGFLKKKKTFIFLILIRGESVMLVITMQDKKEMVIKLKKRLKKLCRAEGFWIKSRGKTRFSSSDRLFPFQSQSQSTKPFSRGQKQAGAWRGESRHWMVKVRHERTQHGQEPRFRRSNVDNECDLKSVHIRTNQAGTLV